MPKKNPAAVALGRLGGKKGGPARAARMTQAERAECARKGGAARMSKLTPEQRSEAARKAVQARWKKVKKLYLNAYLEALEEGAADVYVDRDSGPQTTVSTPKDDISVPTVKTKSKRNDVSLKKRNDADPERGPKQSAETK
jgi:hypothetical protein